METINTLHCPYCNASVTLSEAERQRARITCPSCGDSFANKTSEDIATEPNSPSNTSSLLTIGADQQKGITTEPKAALSLLDGAPQPSLRDRNLRMARILLAIMAGSAIIGLSYALITVNFRRQNDTKPNESLPKIAEPVPGESYPPAKLPALALLPKGCDVVLGMHTHDLMNSTEGKDLLKQLDAKFGTGKMALPADWLGLPEGEIDYAVAGIRLKQELGQDIFLVVRTLKPYSHETIRTATGQDKKVSPPKFRDRPVYLTRPSPISGAFWCKDDYTLVIYWRLGLVDVEKDLAVLPEKAATATTSLSEPLRNCLENRTDAGTLLWVVGETKQLDQLTTLLKFGQLGLKGEAREKLKDVDKSIEKFCATVKVFGLGVRIQKDILLSGNFQTVDGLSATYVNGQLKKLLPSAKVVFPPPNATPEQLWVTAQVPLENVLWPQLKQEPKGKQPPD